MTLCHNPAKSPAIDKMAGEPKGLRKRKSSSSRPRTRGAPANNHDDHKAVDISIHEMDKYTDHNKTKKSVLFQSKGYRSHKADIDVSNSTENRLPSNATGGRTKLHSARYVGSNGLVPSLSSESDSIPRLALRPRRSVSAHPTLRAQNTVTQSTQKSLLTRSASKSCLSPSNSYSEDQTFSSRSLYRHRQKVERLKVRLSSTDSSDSDDLTPRPTFRPSSQPLSPEIIASMTSLAEQNKQAWAHFSNHVKLIDDSTGLISRFPRKTFSSSSVFQKAMNDLYGNVEYGKSRGFVKLKGRVGAIAACASRFLSGAKRVQAENTAADNEEDAFMTEIGVEGPSKETVENAQRGWRILRQYVQEMAAEKRMSKSTLSWNMLTHTIRGLSNMEKTRYELYQKYGLVPMVLSDGTVIQENTMLSERARAALAAKSNKPSQPSQPTRLPSASLVPKNQPYKAIGGFKISGMRTEMV